MKDYLLLGKRIITSESEIVFEYHGEPNFKDYFDVKLGEWKYENGVLIGTELEKLKLAQLKSRLKEP